MTEKKKPIGSQLTAADVRTALNQATSADKYLPEHSAIILRYFEYSLEQGWSLGQAAEKLDVSTGTLSKICRGIYGAKVDSICKKMTVFTEQENHHQAVYMERSKYTEVGFIETSCSELVWQTCKAALNSSWVAFIFGESQTGKTNALEEFQRRSAYGKVHYLRMPEKATLPMIARMVAASCGAKATGTYEKVRANIMDTIKDDALLIVDELHEVFAAYTQTNRIAVIEFFRAIHDITGCGLILCGTHVLKTEIEEGKLALLLNQLRRRGLVKLNIPDSPTRKDLNKIALEYGLPRIEKGSLHEEYIKEIISTTGLGPYFKYLKAASRTAVNTNTPISWDIFTDNYNLLKQLENLNKAK